MAQDNLIGRVVDRRFRIQSLHGTGGMARIYIAEDLQSSEMVAFKVMKDDASADRIAKGRFLREVRNARKLDHNHIVRTIEAGEVDGRLFMAMEFMDQGNVHQLLKSVGEFPWPLALHVIYGIVRGLEYSHEHQIIHRDMKPDNVMANSSGAVKIADFGISKSTEGTKMTKAGEVLGTPAYMSPEQILGEPIDHRTDIFSCGTIFYEIVTGVHPFEDSNISQTAMKVLNNAPSRPERHIPFIPREIGDLIVWMMQKDREDRPQSFRQVRLRIEEIQRASHVPFTAKRFKLFVRNPERVASDIREEIAKARIAEMKAVGTQKAPKTKLEAYNHFTRELLAMVKYSPSSKDAIEFTEDFLRTWNVKLPKRTSDQLEEANRTYRQEPNTANLGRLIQIHESLGNSIEAVMYLGGIARSRPTDDFVSQKIDFHLDRVRKYVSVYLNPAADSSIAGGPTGDSRPVSSLNLGGPVKSRNMSQQDEAVSSSGQRRPIPISSNRQEAPEDTPDEPVPAIPSSGGVSSWLFTVVLLFAVAEGSYIGYLMLNHDARELLPMTQLRGATPTPLPVDVVSWEIAESTVQPGVPLRFNQHFSFLPTLYQHNERLARGLSYRLLWETAVSGDPFLFEDVLESVTCMVPDSGRLCDYLEDIRTTSQPEYVRDKVLDALEDFPEFQTPDELLVSE